jgi:transcriptional regulator with XRE-family HTH domain
MTDASVLAELGHRLERHRIERNLTQDQMADAAGIGRATLQRIERGQSAQLTSVIRLLRAHGLLEGLELAVPEATVLPIAELEREERGGRRRARRAGSDRQTATDKEPWRWGDEPGAGS